MPYVCLNTRVSLERSTFVLTKGNYLGKTNRIPVRIAPTSIVSNTNLQIKIENGEDYVC